MFVLRFGPTSTGIMLLRRGHHTTRDTQRNDLLGIHEPSDYEHRPVDSLLQRAPLKCEPRPS